MKRIPLFLMVLITLVSNLRAQTPSDVTATDNWSIRSRSSTDSSDSQHTGVFLAQRDVAQLPYYCDFEDSVENVNWQANSYHHSDNIGDALDALVFKIGLAQGRGR